MGILINDKGLSGVYAKVAQVNVQNKKETKVTVDENGNETTEILTTNPMSVVVYVYSDSTKANKLFTKEHHVSYDPEAENKNPVNQAYEQIKPLYDIVEDPA